MDKHLEEETLMKKLMEELPMSNEMPPHVRNKALNIAVETNRRAQAARRPRLVAYLTVGLAALTVGAMFLVPKPAAAKAWTLVKQAVGQITSVQMNIEVKNPKEGEPKNITLAFQGNKMMVDAGDEAQVYFSDNTLQVYDAKKNTVTKLIMPGGVMDAMPNIANEIAGAFDLKKEVAQMEEKYGKDHIKIMPIRVENGRRVYDVQMTEKDGPGRAFMTIDAETDLPIFIDADGGKDDENVRITLNYNSNFIVEPNFPANAKIEELDMSKMMGGGMEGKDFGKMFENFGKGFEGMGGKGGSLKL